MLFVCHEMKQAFPYIWTMFRLPCRKATGVEVERSEAQRINREAEMSRT